MGSIYISVLNVCRALHLAIITIFCLITAPLFKEHWICRAVTIAGPAYIKIGQFLASRPDIINSEIAEVLSALQDNVASFSIRSVRKIIAQDFDGAAQFIELRIVAAASIAQVHKAVDSSGHIFAVKVARPDIDKKVRTNIEFLTWLVGALSPFSQKLRGMKLNKVLESIAVSARRELDFRLEAASMSEFAEKTYPGVYIPKVYWELTSRRVLTMEWIDGVTINQVPRCNLSSASSNVAMCFLNQSCKEGFFHADMHHGNMLYMQDGRVALLDFGKTGRLDILERYYLSEIFCGFIKKDYRRVATAHYDVGYIADRSQLGWLISACRTVGESIIGRPMEKTSANRLLLYMLDTAAEFGMQPQSSIMLFHKNLLMLEGTFGKNMDSSFDLWDLAERWLNNEKAWYHCAIRQKIIAIRRYQTLEKTIDCLHSRMQHTQPQRYSVMRVIGLIVFATFTGVTLGFVAIAWIAS